MIIPVLKNEKAENMEFWKTVQVMVYMNISNSEILLML